MTHDEPFVYRDIMTKAVCGRGKRYARTTYRLRPEHLPTTVLGCWVINHRFGARLAGKDAYISGSYDINLWFAYDANSKTDVAKQTVQYELRVPMEDLDEHFTGRDGEVHAACIQPPTCVETHLEEDGQVAVTVELEMRAEIFGETMLRVPTVPMEEGKKDELPKDL
ncbi:MAG: outer spore coat protein CotE [Firmicutes bacterium]|nr:outer spore coat protein CotE [Bacillota bacterium]